MTVGSCEKNGGVFRITDGGRTGRFVNKNSEKGSHPLNNGPGANSHI